MHAFSFDFREMPSVFSRIMLEEQARFVSRAIQLVMSQEPYKGHNFHLLGHSMGGVVNYLATTL